MSIEKLITEHLDIWTAADTEKKSGRGRSSGNAGSVYGIKKLRELILELAVRGKLVPQDARDEPASELLKRIAAEKAKLIAEGKIKKSKPLAEITDDEKPFELPIGWEWVRNGSIFNLRKGRIPKNLSENKIGLPYLDIEALDKGIIRRYSDDLTSPQATSNDILVVCDGSRSGLVLKGKVGIIGSTLSIIDTPDFIQPYVTLIFRQSYERLNSTMKGAAIPHLDIQRLILEVIGLPPISEQHRIVAKVDELMALCDQLENQHNTAAEAHEKLVTHLLGTLTQSQNAENFNSHWQRISEHFDTLFTTEASIDALKQTLLQLAVMGKLVPQDPNDEPASELLKRIQAEKAKLIAEGKIKKDKPLAEITEEEKPFDLPHNWTLVRLSDITSIRGGGTPSMAKSEYWGGQILWVSPKDMHNGIIVDSELKITDKALKESNLELVPVGSILIVGRSGILKRKLPAQITAVPCTVNQDIKAVTPIKPLSDRYMQLIFWGNEKEILIRDVKQGTTVQSLVYDSLFSRSFSLPPVNEQHRIVAKVDELMAICDHLKSRLTEANQLQQKLADVLVEQAVN